MAEIVNLRRVRKARAKAEAADQAAANRAAHGRTREQRTIAAGERQATDRLLDGAKLERDREPRE